MCSSQHPESLREVAATKIPAVSQILMLEFLGGSKLAWFTALPTDIQSYLVQQYGPSTASASVCPLSPFISRTIERPTLKNSATQPTTTQASSPSSSGSSSASSSPSPAAPTTTKYITTLHQNRPRRRHPPRRLALAATLLACCLLLRRRHHRHNYQDPRASRPPTPEFLPTTPRHGHSTSHDRDHNLGMAMAMAMAMGTSPHHPLRGGAGEPLSHRAYDDSGLHGSGIGGPSYEHNPPPPPPPVVPYHPSGSRSRGSFGSLGSVPEGPGKGNGMREGGALPVVPARSPRRLSLGDGGVDGCRGGARGGRGRAEAGVCPAFGLSRFGNAHAGYTAANEWVGQGVEDYDPSYGSAGGYDGGVHDGGGAWYAHQAPASEWPLRNEVGGQLGRKGRPLWDLVYDGTYM
ncbi:hypothetical protein V2W45_1463775 [Cenococcum geophilum]